MERRWRRRVGGSLDSFRAVERVASVGLRREFSLISIYRRARRCTYGGSEKETDTIDPARVGAANGSVSRTPPESD